MTISVLVISGSMGSGKTTVLGEASDLLTAAGIAHAAIDLDALSIGPIPRDLTMRNLAAIWENFAAAGVTRLMIAEAMANREEIRGAIPNADLVICRLRAGIETMQQRVRVREPGMLQQERRQRRPRGHRSRPRSPRARGMAVKLSASRARGARGGFPATPPRSIRWRTVFLRRS